MDILYLDEIITNALKEDIGLGDITTDNVIPAGSESNAYLVAKDGGIVAGLDVCERIFEILDPGVRFERHVADGDRVRKGDRIATIRGNTRALLKGERVALNFLERLSGIATRTNEYCQKVAGTGAKIIDTRKTTPGLRYLEKYAVRVGGGGNHRFSLSQGVLIKDNHIRAAGGIRNAVGLVRGRVPHTVNIEVEVESLEMVREALDCNVDVIMLDNMSLEMMAEAVKIINKRALVEASGNVNLDNVADVARTGVDLISIGGELTQSVKPLDISLEIE